MSIKYLEKYELLKLLRYCKQHDYFMYSIITISFVYGLRVSEILDLKRSDVNFKDNKITFRRNKGSNKTRHTLTPEVRNILKKAEKNYEKRYFKLHRSNVDVRLKKIFKTLRISKDKAHFHAIRHTTAISLLDKGVNVRTIQAILGHKDIKSTMVYLQITGKHIDKENESLEAIISREV